MSILIGHIIYNPVRARLTGKLKGGMSVDYTAIMSVKAMFKQVGKFDTLSAFGRVATLSPRPLVVLLFKPRSVPPSLAHRPLRSLDNEPCFLVWCDLTGAERLEDFLSSGR